MTGLDKIRKDWFSSNQSEDNPEHYRRQLYRLLSRLNKKPFPGPDEIDAIQKEQRLLAANIAMMERKTK